jgi:ketosteroid isomerase-like protein
MIRRLACFALVLFASSAGFAQGLLLARTQAPAQDSAPSTPQVAGVASAAGPEVVEFQKIEDNWAVSINNRDQYGLELVLSPLFVDIAASGDVTTRNQQLAELINGNDKTLHVDTRVITVRELGDVAVVNGTYSLHHKGANGSPVDEKGVYTHVFQRVHNNWLCINSQRTVLREDGPKDKAPKKKSDSELPFHIPIFSKN